MGFQENGETFFPLLAGGDELGIGFHFGNSLVEMAIERFPGELVLPFQPGALDFDLGREGRFVIHALELGLGGVAVVGVDAPLLHVGKERLQFVEIAGLDRIEFVIVTFGAAEGAPEPGRRDGTDALGSVLGEVFLRLGAALAGHHVETVVSGCGELLLGRFGEEIAGELFAGEIIESLVRVERVDDVVAIRENALVLVAVESDGVGKARDVEPPHRHALTEMRRSEETVEMGIVVRRRLTGGRWTGHRQASKIERKPPGENMRGGRGRKAEFFLREFRFDEGIDGITRFRARRRNLGLLQLGVGPVRLILGALGDPAAEELLLFGRERLVGLVRGHGIAFVENADDDLALVRVARDDGEDSVFGLFDGLVADVEPQPGLAGVRIETVAVEAGVRHDGPDVAVKRNFRRSGRLGSVHAGQGNKGDTEDEGDFFHQGNVGEMTGRGKARLFSGGGLVNRSGKPVL